MSTPKKKERQKLIKCFLVFGACEKERKKVRTLVKYTTKATIRESSASSENRTQQQRSADDDDIDESSIALLCLPDGVQQKSAQIPSPSFHSFLITKQNGSRIYGSSLIFWEAIADDESSSNAKIYTNKAYCFLTTIPYVIAMKNLLFYIWKNKCGSGIVQSICNVKMPNKGKCIKLVLPNRKLLLHSSAAGDRGEDFNDINKETDRFLEVYIYRGMSNFPLFDYPFRELFLNVLSLDSFLTAFIATLLEFQILIISSDYHNLMMVAEGLTAVLLPFHWQHVYVPILPSKLGLNYLDAPTPYIMGINSVSSKESIASGSWSSSVQCRIDCDSDKVDYFCEDSDFQQYLLQNIPFLEDLKSEIITILTSDSKLATHFSSLNRVKSSALQRVTEVTRKYQLIANEFTYLDDLKLNQSIRIAFMRNIRKFILNDYEKFIVTRQSSRDSVKFDTVSYLCDQPDYMKPFLSKFLETQMFVSFVDEAAKRLQRNKQLAFSSQSSLTSSISMGDDPDELALFNDLLLETRFSSAQVINILPVKNDQNEDTRIKFICSPMKRRSSRSQSGLNEGSLSPFSQSTKEKSLSENNKQNDLLSSPIRVPAAFAAQTNWKVVESLLKEVKIKTKRILLEKMGNEEIAPLGCGSVGDLEENTLIASLCDLIERIWSHATANDNEHSKCCFWTHLSAFAAIETNVESQSPIDSNILTPALSQMSLDASSSSQTSASSLSTPSSPSKRINSNHYLAAIPTTLHHDYKSVQLMSDVKTDIGKSRAFIRLALERKLLSKHLRTLLSNHSLLVSMYKRYAFLRCEEEREQFLTHLLTLNAVDFMCFTNTFNTSELRKFHCLFIYHLKIYVFETFTAYTLVIYGSHSLSGSISVGGTMCSTSEIYIMNPTTVFTFKHRNLGLLNTLTVCVNQATKIFIEYCFLRNEYTGHTFKFSCNRWFGRNIEDGATERLLIGQLMVNCSIGDVIKNSQQGRSSSIGRHWSRTVETYKDEQLDVEELQEKLGEIINQIVRLYYSSHEQEGNSENKAERLSSSPSKRNGHTLSIKTSCSTLANCYKQYSRPSISVSNLSEPNFLHLLLGEKQLIWTLQEIFYYGFKNRGRSSFRKQIFLWDFLLRVQCELKLLNSSSSSDQQLHEIKNRFISLIDDISAKAANWGKDGKFHLFLIISIRDHLLTHFLKILKKPIFSHQFYESNSFLRDNILNNFLLELLSTFNEMKLVIESSVTKCL
ncbi:DENN domain-containing protein 5A-like protein [Dinothrombium tinctorium]|uniref:DENN domain-containing protein 5A-like protein n=1 Tax=Dinothrombium tinctorium TaxID=1965070 RepID=A0A443QQ24_9ACAR|nr:DENN domain-containing protein 5A-like protein [Dinothrombium tinctorium]